MRILTAILLLALTTPLTAGTADSPFDRGDVNQDGFLNIADPVAVLEFLFAGGAPPACDDAADSNDDGQLNIGDGVYLLGHLFVTGSPPPPAPFQIPGPDPTPDALGCNPIDCLTELEVTALLGIFGGSIPLPGAVPETTTPAGIANIIVGPGDATINISSVVYDFGTQTISATGTVEALAVPVTIDFIVGTDVTCSADLGLDWSLTATLMATPYAPGATQLLSVDTVNFSTSNTSIDFASCGVSGAIASALAALFASTIDDLVNSAVQPFLSDITAQVDALLATTTVLVCDPTP